MTISSSLNFIPRSLKFWITWFLITALTSLFVSLAQMYSREGTLDNVRKIDFGMVHDALTINQDPASQSEIFNKISGNLVLGKTALFQLAILNHVTCIDNGAKGKQNPALCVEFKNIQEWAEKSILIPNENANSKYPSVYEFANYKSDSYLFSHIGNGSILIGKAGDYAKNNPYGNRSLSYAKRVTNYYLGTLGGFNQMMYLTEMTRYLLFIISLIATLLWLFVTHQFQKKHQSTIASLQSTIKGKEEKWGKLKTIHNNVSQKLRLKESEIKNLQLKIEDEKNVNDSNLDYLQNQAIALEDEREALLDELIENQDLIIRLEQENDALLKEKEELAENLNQPKLVYEYKKLSEEIKDIKRLWRTRTNWADRLKIEEHTSPDKTRIPFTLSTAFITFERHVDKLYEDSLTHFTLEEIPLLKKIDSVWANRPKERERSHRIRKARNDWFHYGTRPNDDVILELIEEIINEDALL